MCLQWSKRMHPLSLLLLAVTLSYSVLARSPEEREFLHINTARRAAGDAKRPQDTRWKQNRADAELFHRALVVSQVYERSRHKRAVKRNSQWVDKVVPYVFSEEVSDVLRKMFREFMDYAEKNTCIRFWDKGNASTSHATSPYGPLNTTSFVTIVTRPACYSIVGGSGSGTMSPCPRRLDYTHEFGHLLGKIHDLALPERINFIDPNIENAGPYYWNTQEQMPLGDMDNIMSCGFSSQSIMLYNQYLVTKYGWPTYTFLYDDLGGPTLDSIFMYFKEINIIQRCCGDTDCVSRVCANEGYQGMVDGKCQCVCPIGFDTATNCTTVLSKGCGGVYELSPALTSVTVTTTGYPGKYGVNAQCDWAFKAAEGSQIVLTFSNVDIGCGATLSLGRYMFSDPPIRITKTGKVKPYLSINNKALVRFSSGNTSCNWNGFKLTAKLAPADDLPYDLASKGESYHGRMNYALGFEKCLPWSQGYGLANNLYNITHSTSLDYCDFEGDFCRNCGQKRSKPYCMTAIFERNVTFKYCDVAQSVPPYDLIDDCSSSLHLDPGCQDYETRRVCFKSCMERGKIQDYPEKETPAIHVSCGEPVILNDVIKASTDSAPYRVGQKITLKCKLGNLQRKIMCLSDGTWSILTNFCSGCPGGFVKVKDHCYSWLPSAIKGQDAFSHCNALVPGFSAPVWVETWDEFVNVILPLRNSNSKIPVSGKMWIGMKYTKNTWVWEYNGQRVSTSSFAAQMWKNRNANGIPGTNDVDVAVLLPENNINKNRLARARKDNFSAWALCKVDFRKMNGSDSCGDRKNNCQKSLAQNPRFAQERKHYAEIYCPYTAGLCNTSYCCVTKPCCSNTTIDRILLKTGEFVTYSCNNGSLRVSGNQYRACRPNGTLTGTELVCAPIQSVNTYLNNFHVTDTRSATPGATSLAGPSPYFSADRSAKLQSCRAYCRKDGDIFIQFWRRVNSGAPRDFTLVGSNVVTCIGGRAVTWTFDSYHRFDLQRGDFLGLLDPRGGTVAMQTCKGTKTLAVNLVMRSYSFINSLPIPGSTYTFSASVDCWNYMVDCVIGPN
ncbi:uncharacterized protein [Haliotis cracherodii]|uniref:uncharacterized protein n=1 Tax=Haliotis cracherodii TaxID=6455 RepID=UPI0039EB7444